MSDINVRAVITGSLVDVVGSFVLGYLFFVAVAAAAGVSTADAVDAIYLGSVPLQGAQLALGLAMTAIGAFVGARLAGRNERVNAFAVGVISTAVGFTVVFAAPESAPFWTQAAGLILTIPAAFAGGEIARFAGGRGRRAT